MAYPRTCRTFEQGSSLRPSSVVPQWLACEPPSAIKRSSARASNAIPEATMATS